MKLIKKHEVLGIIAKSNSSLYSDIKLGLMAPPVSIGEKVISEIKKVCKWFLQKAISEFFPNV